MSKRYPLYELMLKLYPKQFQRKYSRQMVQTMADMLDDQPNKAGRTLVWLRACFDLVFTIVQQNIMLLGENVMNRSTITNKRLAGVLGVLLLLMIGVFHTRIQTNVVPAMVKPFYMHGVETALLEQNKTLQDPIARLYGTIPKAKNGCNAGPVQGIHTVVDCQSTVQAYTKLTQGTAGEQAAETNVQKIETTLAANGYSHGTNSVTLTSLVMGTYQGKDYSPDAFYEKVVGDYDCVLDTTVAYSNPSQPAINTTFWCARTINVLGTPGGGFYQSDKGMMVNQ